MWLKSLRSKLTSTTYTYACTVWNDANFLKGNGKNEKYKQDVWRPLAFVSGERDTNKTYFRPNIVWQGMKLHLL